MFRKINVILFLIVIFGMGIGLFVFPKEKISVSEKRRLADIPTFSFKNYINGKWIDSMDHYIDDHFPFRAGFISSSEIGRAHV